MSIEDARVVIIEMFRTQFDVLNPTIPIKYPNQKFDQPSAKPWVSIVIMGGESFQANLGISNITERSVGIVQIDIMFPEDQGTKQMSELSETIGRIYSRKQKASGLLGSIVFKTPDIEDMGIELGFYHYMIRIPFRRDQKYQT